MPRIRFVTYNRVSTEEEKQKSALQHQIRENREYVLDNPDWELVDEYIDEGKSATTTRGRADFLRLMSDIDEDKFDAVLIKHLDRGFRNTTDWGIFELLLYASKKRLYVRLDRKFYDPKNDSDWISAQMINLSNAMLSRNYSSKTNNKQTERMKKGTSIVTNGMMWGYKQEKGQLQIIEEEAEIIRFIFNKYIEGFGFREIARMINAKGVKTRTGSGEFPLSTLKRIIRNEKYMGTLICGKTHFDFFTKEVEKQPEENWYIHKNKIPAIIDEETWQKANEILYSRRKKANIDDKEVGYFQGRYPLSGKIACSKCGKTFMHNKYKSMVQAVWQCKSYRDNGRKGCDNITLKYDDLNRLLKRAILDFLKNKDLMIENMISILQLSIQDKRETKKVDEINKRIKELQNKKKKSRELLIEGVISREDYTSDAEDYDNKIRLLKDSLGEKDKEHQEQNDKKERLSAIKMELNKFKFNNIDSIPDEILNHFVTKILVHPDNKLEIILFDFFPINVTYEKTKEVRKSKGKN